MKNNLIEYNEDRTKCKITINESSDHTLFNVDAIYFPASANLIKREAVSSIGTLHLHNVGTLHMHNGYLDFGSYSLPLDDIASVEFDTGTHIEKVTINLK